MKELLKLHKPLMFIVQNREQMDKIKEDESRLQLRCLKTVQPNRFSEFVSVVCKLEL